MLKFIWFIGLFICKIAFLVIYNSKVIKSQIFCFVVLSWPPHLSILHPYLKLSAPDVVRNLNVKVFNLMSRTNETRHIEWYETCKCKCRLYASICNNKQRWNDDKVKCECKYLIERCVR